MRRRALLTSMAAVAGTAGCVSSGSGPGAGPTDSETTAPGEDATDSPTDSPTDVHTDTRTMTETPPQPEPATDVFADFECPSFAENADETVCYHQADADAAELLLTAQPEVFDPSLGDDDVETLDFTLYNRSAWPVSFNPYDWGIERYEDGAWTHVAPDAVIQPMTEVGPGGTVRWVLPAESGWSPPETEGGGEDGNQVYPLSVALDPGVYAFHHSVSYGGVSMDTPTDAPKPTDSVELVALFRVEEAIDPRSDDDGAQSTTVQEEN